MLSLAGSILSCQNAQLVKSLEACERVRLAGGCRSAPACPGSRAQLIPGCRALGTRGAVELGSGGGDAASGGPSQCSLSPGEGFMCLLPGPLRASAGLLQPAGRDADHVPQPRLPEHPRGAQGGRPGRGKGSLGSSRAPHRALQASAAHPAPPQDLLFSVCGLTVFSTIICTLSAVVCCIQIFSLDIVHVVSPSPGPGADGAGEQHSQAGGAPGCPGCGLSPRTHVPRWISGLGVPALPPLPAAGPPALELCDTGMHVPPRHLSAEHDRLRGVRAPGAATPLLPTRVHLQLRDRRAEVPGWERGHRGADVGGPFASKQGSSHPTWLFCSCLRSITYNGSMDSPVPLYPTDFPPSYETVMGLRGDSQVGDGGLRAGAGPAGLGSCSARALTAPSHRPPCSTRS